MSQQEVSAAAEKLTVRELNIRTLHNGNLILSFPRLQWNTSLVFSLAFTPRCYLSVRGVMLKWKSVNPALFDGCAVCRGAALAGISAAAAGGDGAPASPAAARRAGQRVAAGQCKGRAAQPDPAAGQLSGQG